MTAVIDAVAVSVAVAVMYVAARAYRCNLRLFRLARATPPLDGLDLSDATVRPARAPAPWPDIDSVADPKQAAAYAALADDRAVTCALLGQLLLVVGSAATGTALPLSVHLYWKSWLLSGALIVALLGVAVQLRATRKWEPVARRYRQRYTELTQQPPPAPVPRRRWWQRDATA